MPRKPARPGTVRIAVEQLEDRAVPALFNVLASVQAGPNQANYGCVVTGDFNNDGKTDMVATNYGTAAPGNNAAGQTISRFLGNGDGTFAAPSNITVGANAYVSYAAVGDLNNDGNQDLAVVATQEDSTGRLYIYLGTGLGGFNLTAQGAISTGSSNVSWVCVGQMTTGDSNLDVVVCGFGDSDQGQTTVFGNNITVFQGDGTGSVANIGTVTNGLAFIPTSIALADFDGDGDNDIAATVPGVPPDVGSAQPNGTVQIINSNGAGGFTLGNSFDTGGALSYGLAVAKLNNDNLPDLVITNAGDPDADGFYANFGLNSNVGVAINAGGGSFNVTNLTAGLGTGGSKSVFAATAADFTGDGKQDIAAVVYGHPLTGANARILLYTGNGTGSFSSDADSPYNTLTTDGQFLAAAPIDAGSSIDIVYVTASRRYGVLTNTTAPPASTTTTLTAPTFPATVTFPANVTFTANVTGGVPDGGTVTFLRGTTVIGTGTTAGGVANFTTTTPIPAGTYSITARYEGVTGFATSTSSAGSLTVDPAATSTALISSSDPSVFGQSVTFTATVTSGGNPVVGGTVNFFDGATPLGTATTNASGVATFGTTALTVGVHPITATFVAGGNFATSTSAAVQQDVNPAATTVTLGSNADPSNFGDPVTFTATVAVVAPGGGTVSGTVEFREGATVLGTGTVTGGVATFQTTALAVGAHPITAVYLTSTNHATSSSTVLTQDVNGAAVAVQLGSSSNPSTFGQSVTFTATLTSAVGNPTSGTVEFRDGGTLIGTGTLNGTNTATFTTSTLTQAVHPITATFLATGNYAQGVSGTLNQTVNAPANTNTATSVGSSGSPSIVTQNVTITATVNPPVGGPTPTGSVQFFIDGVAGPLVALTGNTASFQTTALALGNRVITATYVPTGAFNASASTPFTQQVIQAPTGVGIGSNSSPTLVTQPVTLTATVVATPASMVPTGSVIFFDGGVAISGPVTLTNGVATFQTSALGVGSHSITAQYAANGNFGGSTSNPITQVVNKIGTTIVSLGTNSQPVAAGASVTFTATIAANSAIAGMPQGTITFKANGTAIGSGQINGAVATLTTTLTPAGTYTITAEYAGDATFDGSTSGNLTQTVTGGGGGGGGGTTPTLVGFREFGVGAGAGGSGVGQFFNPDGTKRFDFNFFPGFTGGVRVTSADFTGDGIADMVAGTGPGGPSKVRVLNGATQQEIFSIDPFEAAFVGGVYVSSGDLNGDGKPELLISPDEGGGPRVRVFSGVNFAAMADFFGIDDPNFRGGARTHVGDVNGDGFGDLAVAAGFGGGPRVSVISGPTVTSTRTRLFGDFFVFEEALRNGAFIAIGDVDGDGKAEVVGGGGPGGGPRVTAYSAADLLTGKYTQIVDFFAGNIDNRGGVRLAVRDLDGDTFGDLVTGDGTGGGSRVTGYLGKDLRSGAPAKFSFDAYPGFNGGVYVG